MIEGGYEYDEIKVHLNQEWPESVVALKYSRCMQTTSPFLKGLIAMESPHVKSGLQGHELVTHWINWGDS
ncbi:hypothetical protein D3C75_1078030 [compost metagenome]